MRLMLLVTTVVLAFSASLPAAERWEGPFYVQLVEWNKDGRAVVFKVGTRGGVTDTKSRFITAAAEPDVARGFSELLTAALINDRPIRLMVNEERQDADGHYWKIVSTIQLLRAEPTAGEATPEARPGQ